MSAAAAAAAAEGSLQLPDAASVGYATPGVGGGGVSPVHGRTYTAGGRRSSAELLAQHAAGSRNSMPSLSGDLGCINLHQQSSMDRGACGSGLERRATTVLNRTPGALGTSGVWQQPRDLVAGRHQSNATSGASPLQLVDAESKVARMWREHQMKLKRTVGAAEAILEPRYELAVMYMKDAMYCNPPSVYRPKPGPIFAAKCRQILYFPVMAAVYALLLLSFIEVPRWCREGHECRHQTYEYPTWEMGLIDWRYAQVYEGVCLALLLADFALRQYVLGWRQGLRDSRMVHALVLTVSLVDLFASLFGSATQVRLSPYLRVVFMVLYDPALRRDSATLLAHLPDIFGKIVFLWAVYVALFTWFGVVLFGIDEPEGRIYFPDYMTGLWSLAVLLTTNNSPDVFMPALESNRLNFFYFLLFVIFGLFFFVNLVIGVVISAHNESKSEQMLKCALYREHAVDSAFHNLAVSRDPVTKERVITAPVLEEFFKALNKDYSMRHVPTSEMDILISLLDRDRSGNITKAEFATFPEVLQIEVARLDVVFLRSVAPKLWESAACRWVQDVMTLPANFGPFVMYYPWPHVHHQHDASVTVSICLRMQHGVDNVSVSFPTRPTLGTVFYQACRLRELIAKGCILRRMRKAGAGEIAHRCWILDEFLQKWVPLTEDFQLFHTCQVFVIAPGSLTTDFEPPNPDDLPEARGTETLVINGDAGHPAAGGSRRGTLMSPNSVTAASGASVVGTRSKRSVVFDTYSSDDGEAPTTGLLSFYDEQDPLLSPHRLRQARNGEDPDACCARVDWHPMVFHPFQRSTIFDVFVDFVLLINAVLVVWETWDFLEGTDDHHTPRHWQRQVDLVFTVFYAVEALIKLGVFGLQGYWRKLSNRFDFAVMLCCVVAMIILLLPNRFDDPKFLKLIVMARILRLTRVFQVMHWFKVFMNTLLKALPSAMIVAQMQFCVMFIFATLGGDLFGGCINRDPTSTYYHKLVEGNSTYAVGDVPWTSMNFNDMSSGFTTLFACLIMNNWNNYVLGYELTTSKWARVYFEAFWIVGVLCGMNLVIAFLTSTFSNEWTEIKHRAPLRLDPNDGKAKTRGEFFDCNYSLEDWLRAEEPEGNHIVEVEGAGRFQVTLRGDTVLQRGADGLPMTTKEFLDVQLEHHHAPLPQDKGADGAAANAPAMRDVPMYYTESESPSSRVGGAGPAQRGFGVRAAEAPPAGSVDV